MAPIRRCVALALLVAALALALLTVLLGVAPAASAHATVTGSNPADGQRLATEPAQVTITFDEPVTLGDLGYLHVTDSAGARVDAGGPFHPGGDGAKVAARLRPGLPDGGYTESFRVISADSHPVVGSIAFVIGHGSVPVTSGAAAGSATDRATAVVFGALRWVSYAGFALLGGLWLLLGPWTAGRSVRRARALVWAGWTATVAGALGELWLQGPYGAGLGPSALGRWPLLDDTLHTSYGQVHSARLVLLGALAVLLGRLLRPAVPPARRYVADAAWPVVVGVGLTFSLIGHPDTTDPRWLSIAADLVHLCAMAAWVGGLTMLLGVLLPRREAGELRATLPVVSRVAFGSVVALAVTGAYAAWRGIGSWTAVVHTDYGLLVDAKVVLFVGLIALGNVSRHVVQRRLAPAGGPAATEHERVRRAVVVELTLAGLVLAATAVLVDQPRGPEALAARDREPVTATAPISASQTATVTVEPGVHGAVSIEVDLGVGPRPSQLTASALQARRQLGPIPIPLREDAPNHYSASGVDLPAPGRWTITLVVTESTFDAVTSDATIELH